MSRLEDSNLARAIDEISYRDASFAVRITKSKEGEDNLLVTNFRDMYLGDLQYNKNFINLKLPLIGLKFIQSLVLASLIKEKAYRCTNSHSRFGFLYGYIILLVSLALLQNSFVPSIKEIIFLHKLRIYNREKGNKKKVYVISYLIFIEVILGIASCFAVVFTISNSTEFFSMLQDCLSLSLLYELDDALLKFFEFKIKIDHESVKVHEENKNDMETTSMNISKIVYILLALACVVYRSRNIC